MARREQARYPSGHPKAGQFRKEETGPYKDEKTQDFLELAMERFKLSEAAEARWRREALEDFEFYAGEQWPVDIKTQRDHDRRPCLTINRLKPSKRIITNEYRQQRPALQVNPEGNGATVETAEIMQGIVRHVEVNSDAEVGYDTTFDNMVIGGLGWIEVDTRYQKRAPRRSDGTRPQELTIRGAKNAFMHYADPGAEEFDYSDADYHFKIFDFTRREFKSRWPNAKAASLDDFGSVGDNAKDWLQKDAVRVAVYWYMAKAEKAAEAADDEEEPDLDETPAPADSDEAAANLAGGEDDGQDQDDDDNDDERICRRSVITAVDILEDKETVFDSIPNVPMCGEDLDINGRRYLAGMVRDAKDPQRQFNFWESKCTEAIALAPAAPYKGYAKVIENHEAQWQAANRSNDAVLIGNAVVVEGQLLPLPVRESPDVDITGLAAMRQSSAANLEAVTGLNDATLGRMRPDESGKAVLARQKQGDITNLNYSDNAARCLRRVGRLILPAIRKVYDVPTILRIINPDGTSDHVITHTGDDGHQEAAQQLQQDNPAIKQVLDLSVGTYDVTVSVGPSYQTKRQEAVASIMALIQAAPNVISIVGDLLVGNMDWNNAPEIAKRLKKMLPPQLQDDEGQGDPQNQVQQLQQQLSALQQVHGEVMNAFQQATQIIQTKQIEQRGKFSIEKLKTDAAMAQAMFDRVTKLELANISAQAQDKTARTAADADMLNNMHDAAHETALSAQEHGQSMEQAKAASDAAAVLASQTAAGQQQPGAGNDQQTSDQAQG
jgi:hypothetical protein